MSFRNEVLNELKECIAENGAVILDNSERHKGIKKLEVAEENCREARKACLEHQLARFYRVVIFGSARLGEESDEFIFISGLTTAIVKAIDVDIVTGGGPGIMEAALYGAQIAIDESKNNGKKLKAKNHGVKISLPKQEPANKYIHISTKHPDFSTRLQEFTDKTQAAYVAPGGIGTQLELLYLVQTRQVGHLEKEYPVIAHPFWRPVVDSWYSQMYYNRLSEQKTPLISPSDLEIIQFSDNIPDIVEIFKESHRQWRREIRDHVRVVRSLK